VTLPMTLNDLRKPF